MTRVIRARENPLTGEDAMTPEERGRTWRSRGGRASDRHDRNEPDEAFVAVYQSDPESPAARRAASTLLGRYQRSVYVWCFRYTREHESACDLAQEVLVRAYRSLDAFRGDSQFSSWLFVIARNRCLNAVRRPSLVRDDAVDPDVIAAAVPGPDVDTETRETRAVLARLMTERLDDTERRALALRYHEQMPVDEITNMLEIAASSGARGVLQSARRKLRAALAEMRAEEEAAIGPGGGDVSRVSPEEPADG